MFVTLSFSLLISTTHVLRICLFFVVVLGRGACGFGLSLHGHGLCVIM